MTGEVDADLVVKDAGDRIFRCWATVQVRDKQGETIPLEAFIKTMPTLMTRGAPLMIMHSNKHVGRLLNYEQAMNPKYNEMGMIVTCQVFKNYSIDDEAWQDIQDGNFTGVSVGGQQAEADVNGHVAWIEPVEFSLADIPANPGAVMKSISMAKADLKKPFADYADFKDCVGKNSNKNDPQAFCAAIMQAVEGDKVLGKNRSTYKEGGGSTIGGSMPDNEEPKKKEEEAKKQEPEKDKKPEEETKKQGVIPTTPEEPKPKEEEPAPAEKQGGPPEVMNMLVEIQGGIAKIAELLTAAQAPAASAPLAETAKKDGMKKQGDEKPEEKKPESEPPKEPEKKDEESKPAEEAATKALKKSALPTDTPRPPGSPHYDPTKAGVKPGQNDTAVAVAKGEKVFNTRETIQKDGLAN